MTETGIKIVTANITKNINFESQFTTYSRRRIFKNAHRILKAKSYMSFGECLKEAWNDAKKVVLKARKEVTALKNQLLNLFTPEKYTTTQEYMNENMMQAFNNGANLNK